MSTTGYQSLPLAGVPNWRLPVATAASLPASGNNLGDARAVEDSGVIYVWTGSSWTAPSGAGTVTSVDCSVPNFLSVSGAPITGAGTIAIALATQVKNKVFAGRTTGADAAPSFRSLVGADLPLPAAATLGGVFSKGAVTNNFLTSISSVDGSVGQAQPSFSNISGTVAASQLPLPTASTLGGVFSKAAVTNNFLTSISSVDGSVGQAQPSFSNISGTVAASQLPNPSASTLGGVESIAAVSHNFLTSISTSGVPAQAQPAFSDISGTASLTTQVTGVLPVANGGTNSSTANVLLDMLCGMIDSPSNKTYTLVQKAAYPFTINTLDIVTVSGTCTVAVKINGTNVTGISAVSVSSTPATGTASGANTVAAGDTVTMVVSSNSSAADMSWTLKYTRT